MGADLTPGLAAGEYAKKKLATYGDQDNFVAFIVETGGRVSPAGLQFLDGILPAQAGGAAAARERGRTAQRAISRECCRARAMVVFPGPRLAVCGAAGSSGAGPPDGDGSNRVGWLVDRLFI